MYDHEKRCRKNSTKEDMAVLLLLPFGIRSMYEKNYRIIQAQSESTLNFEMRILYNLPFKFRAWFMYLRQLDAR